MRSKTVNNSRASSLSEFACASGGRGQQRLERESSVEAQLAENTRWSLNQSGTMGCTTNGSSLFTNVRPSNGHTKSQCPKPSTTRQAPNHQNCSTTRVYKNQASSEFQQMLEAQMQLDPQLSIKNFHSSRARSQQRQYFTLCQNQPDLTEISPLNKNNCFYPQNNFNTLATPKGSITRASSKNMKNKSTVFSQDDNSTPSQPVSSKRQYPKEQKLEDKTSKLSKFLTQNIPQGGKSKVGLLRKNEYNMSDILSHQTPSNMTNSKNQVINNENMNKSKVNSDKKFSQYLLGTKLNKDGLLPRKGTDTCFEDVLTVDPLSQVHRERSRGRLANYSLVQEQAQQRSQVNQVQGMMVAEKRRSSLVPQSKFQELEYKKQLAASAWLKAQHLTEKKRKTIDERKYEWQQQAQEAFQAREVSSMPAFNLSNRILSSPQFNQGWVTQSSSPKFAPHQESPAYRPQNFSNTERFSGATSGSTPQTKIRHQNNKVADSNPDLYSLKDWVRKTMNSKQQRSINRSHVSLSNRPPISKKQPQMKRAPSKGVY